MAATIKTELKYTDAGFVTGMKAAAEQAKKIREELQQKVAPAQERVAETSRKTTIALRESAQATRGSGQGFLQLAQFADDAQYGIKGVLNNIPGLVMGFGAGAGLAGAISLAVLAAAKLGPLLAELYSNADSKAVVEGAKQYGQVLADNLKTIRETRQEMETQRALAQSESGNRSMVEKATGQGQRGAMLDAQVAQLKRVREAEDQLAAARAQAAQAEARARGESGEEQAMQAEREALERKLRRIAEDKTLYEQITKTRADEANSLNRTGENFAAGFKASIDAAEAELQRLERNSAFSKASEAQAQTEFDGVKDKGYSKREQETENLKKAKERAQADAEALALQKAQLESLKRQSEEAAAIIAAKAKASGDQATAAAAELMDLERQKKLQEEIAQISERERRARAQATANEAAAEAAKKAAAAKEMADAKAKAAEDKAKSAAQSEMEIVNTNRILRLRANGQKAQADALEKEIAIRAQADALIARGVDPQRALALAREQARLQEQLATKKDQREQTRSRRPGTIGMRSPEQGRFLPTRIGGLRNTAEATERKATAAARTNPAEDAAMRYYENSIKKQDEMVEIWKTLNIIS